MQLMKPVALIQIRTNE